MLTGLGNKRWWPLSRNTLLWWLALAMLIWGVSAPLFTIHQFWIFDNQVSLLSGLWQLLEQGEWPLFVLIGAFSVLFPLFKLAVLYPPAHGLSVGSRASRYLVWLDALGKWSMLDVFVVAVLVVAVKLGRMMKVEVHFGVYVFAFAVILSMVLARMTKDSDHDPSTS